MKRLKLKTKRKKVRLRSEAGQNGGTYLSTIGGRLRRYRFRGELEEVK